MKVFSKILTIQPFLLGSVWTWLLLFFSFIGLLIYSGFSNTFYNPEGDSVKDKNLYLILSNPNNISEEYLTYLIDSLNCYDSTAITLINELKFYKEIRSKTAEEMSVLIDSIISLDSVPSYYFNVINFHLAILSATEILSENEVNYPAKAYYRLWNTDFPHSIDSLALDSISSTYLLLLSDTVTSCDYHSPIHKDTLVITSKFGWRKGRIHAGIDIDLEVGDTIYSAFSGMVRYAKPYKNYGRLVVIRHYNGLETYYGHLHRIKVKPGQIINAGDIIGLGGKSGNSTGSHLHFEVRFKGFPINPAHLISFNDKKLLTDTVSLKRTQWGYTAYTDKTTFYTVQNGDYPFKIAKKHGITIKNLCELNCITKYTKLVPGEILRLNL